MKKSESHHLSMHYIKLRYHKTFAMLNLSLYLNAYVIIIKHLEHVRSKGNNRPIDAIRQGKFVITTTTIPSYVELKDYLYAGDILRGFKFALQNPKMVYEKILKGQEYIRNFYEPKQIANKWLELERKIISEESI